MDTPKNILKSILTVLMVLFFMGFVFAQEKPGQKPKVKTTSEMKELEGVVGGITKHSISLIISQDATKGEETEMLLPFSPKEIQLEHKKKLNEIAVGDTVKVTYVEETEDDGQGNKKTAGKARVISFISAAVKKAKTEALVSEEPLTLKGTK